MSWGTGSQWGWLASHNPTSEDKPPTLVTEGRDSTPDLIKVLGLLKEFLKHTHTHIRLVFVSFRLSCYWGRGAQKSTLFCRHPITICPYGQCRPAWEQASFLKLMQVSKADRLEDVPRAPRVPSSKSFKARPSQTSPLNLTIS